MECLSEKRQSSYCLFVRASKIGKREGKEGNRWSRYELWIFVMGWSEQQRTVGGGWKMGNGKWEWIAHYQFTRETTKKIKTLSICLLSSPRPLGIILACIRSKIKRTSSNHLITRWSEIFLYKPFWLLTSDRILSLCLTKLERTRWSRCGLRGH